LNDSLKPDFLICSAVSVNFECLIVCFKIYDFRVYTHDKYSKWLGLEKILNPNQKKKKKVGI